MGIKEKLEICAYKTWFTLLKGELSYKCYNEYAMVFVHNVKEYKVSSKLTKHVVAVGLTYKIKVSSGIIDEMNYIAQCMKEARLLIE